MENSFDFLLPSLVLRGCVENYYMAELSVASEVPEIQQKPISNGRVELFIGYQNTRGTCYTNAGTVIKTQSAIVGAHKLHNTNKVKALDPECKTIKFVSINFKPGGFYGVFKIPPAEIYNGFFDTQDVLGKDIRYLQEQLGTSKTPNERKRLVDSFLVNHLNRNYYKQYKIGQAFQITDFVEFRKGNVNLSDFMDEFRCTERTLERNFKAGLGLSLKEYSKIIRFNHVFNHLNRAHIINWGDIVYNYGYYDQSHMINEFKRATGITPGLFVKYRYKTLFKLDNHLVMLDPSGLHAELNEILKKGEDGLKDNLNKYANYK